MNILNNLNKLLSYSEIMDLGRVLNVPKHLKPCQKVKAINDLLQNKGIAVVVENIEPDDWNRILPEYIDRLFKIIRETTEPFDTTASRCCR